MLTGVACAPNTRLILSRLLTGVLDAGHPARDAPLLPLAACAAAPGLVMASNVPVAVEWMREGGETAWTAMAALTAVARRGDDRAGAAVVAEPRVVGAVSETLATALSEASTVTETSTCTPSFACESLPKKGGGLVPRVF